MTTSETLVVRLRRCNGEIVQDCDVYIGGAVKRGGWDLPRSEWQNPYAFEWCTDIELHLMRYELYLRNERPDLMARLPELYGKVLGCWCKPGPCHGDVLVKLVEECKWNTHGTTDTNEAADDSTNVITDGRADTTSTKGATYGTIKEPIKEAGTSQETPRDIGLQTHGHCSDDYHCCIYA